MSPRNEPDIDSSNLRILYVEDHADTLELVSYILTLESYEVVVAADVEQAARLAEKERFDLYLIDNWMPGASGIELCLRLRKFDNDTPILFYSGAAYEQDKRAAFAAGAQAYLAKPVETEELVEGVSRLIADARRSRTAVNLANLAARGDLG